MKRFLVAGIAGVSVFGAAYGFAASTQVTSDDFGSGDDSVATCDESVQTSYTTSYDAADKRYEVTNVVVEGIDDAKCANFKVGVTLTGPDGTDTGTDDDSVGDGASTVVADDVKPNVTASVAIAEAPAAASVTGVHVVIYNGNSTSAEADV